MKEEIGEIRTKLQDMIARSERDNGVDSEITSALRSADDALNEAEEAIEVLEDEEEESDDEGSD